MQAKLTSRGTYELQIRPDLPLEDNQVFRDDISKEEYRQAIREARKKKIKSCEEK